MKTTSYKIDNYSVEIYANDRKGARTRWGDRLIHLYSKGEHIGQATFACEGNKAPEPYFSGEKIYYFAPSYLYSSVIDLLRNEKPVFIAWRPISDPKEPKDGDAFFYTDKSSEPDRIY